MSGSSRGGRGGTAVVAVDVGGTSMKAGVLAPSGCHELRRVTTGRERGPDAVVMTIADTVVALDDWCRAHGLDVVGACVAVPGIVDDERGIAKLSVNLGWRDCPLRDLVDPRRGYPMALTHDVRAGAIAESTFGAAVGTSSSMFVPIGTGLAAATVIDGAILAGATAQAGEIGQVLLDPPVTGADSDERVTLERVASAQAIAHRYHRASGHAVGPAEVLARSELGDEIAVAVVSEAMRSLGNVIAAAVATIDPAIVVLGGGLTSDSAVLARRLADALGDELPWRSAPPVVTARFSADAGFVGTALVAWERAAGRQVAELSDVLSAEWTGTPVAVPG